MPEPEIQAVPRPEDIPGRLIDVRELAQILNVPVSWLYEHTRKGAIPSIRVGKYVRFNPQEVLAFFRAKSPDGNLLKDAVS